MIMNYGWWKDVRMFGMWGKMRKGYAFRLRVAA